MAGGSDKKLMPDTINRHIGNVYPALAMLAGMQLDVFSPLAKGPLPAADVATALGVETRKIEPLLYALVTAGLLEVSNDRFSNTEEAQEFLVKDNKRYLGSAHSAYSDLWSSTMHTAESIRTGVPQAKHDFSSMSQDELRAFRRGLDAGAGATARRLDKTFDMKRFGTLLDAGGGSGGVAIALCEMCPELNATVAELANVASVTRECVSQSAVADRLSVVDVDLIQTPPPGDYDAVVLRSVLQVLGEDQAIAVTKNVSAALKSGGELFVVGRMLDDSRLSPLDAVAVNVMFLNVYDDGQAYTESTYRTWLGDAGLIELERIPLAGGYSLMHGTKS